MCGLVGVAGAISVKQEGVFKQLLQLDTIRGPHSTGILAVDARASHCVLKKVGTPWDLEQYKGYEEIFRATLNVLMGHNRWATKGKINSTNAHPFEHGHIIGAHNGTLRNQSLLPDHLEYEVDSDNIFHAIETIGVAKTVAKLAGAFALTWYDKFNESINFIRNDERPLWICEDKEEKTVFWASERWMLEIVLQKADIKYKEPFQPKPGQLFTYKLEHSYQPKAFKAIEVADLELHTYPVYVPPAKTTGAGTGNSGTGKSANGNVFEKEDKRGKKLITPNELILQGSVEFFASSLRTSEETGAQWISCGATQDDCEIELRLYINDQKLADWVLNSVHLFEGKVRSFLTLGGHTYAILDPTSIIELFKKDESLTEEEEEEWAVIYGGEIISETNFELLVSCGCGNCKAVPTIAESEEIVWLDKLNFICGECVDLPVVSEFIERAFEEQYAKENKGNK